jgi:hypothetical protein
LNGTAAQFDIISPPDDSRDFWIKRGAPYRATSMELQPFDEWRRALFGSYGFLAGENSPGFGQSPFQDTIIGFDGEDYPAFSIAVTAVSDIDDIYFSLFDLSYWLGFSVEWTWETGDNVNILTVPPSARTPSRHIRRDTFPVGSRQVIDYAHTLRVRTGAGNHYDTLTFVNRGDEFEILDYSQCFVKIETEQGRGWIFAGFLSRRPTAEVFSPSPPKNIVSIPDLNMNLWTYPLRFINGTLHDLVDEYESRYGIVHHEGGSAFAIRTDTPIPFFELLEVGHGGGDRGIIYFYPGEVLHSFDVFTPQDALVITTHFGTMPRIAVSFPDENNTRRYFTIQQSGLDGSILLTEFPLDVPAPF